MTTRIDNNDLLGARKINLLSHQETQYPELMRLTADFDLCVVESMSTDSFAKQLTLMTGSYQQVEPKPLTPGFKSLAELERFASENMTDLLQDYLFGQVQIPVAQRLDQVACA